MTVIQIQVLEKSYKGLHVLRGVDFEVQRGTIFALLASNGFVMAIFFAPALIGHRV